MTAELPDDVRAFLAAPNPAVMGTLAADGHPVTVATWYLLEDDGRVLLNLDARRARLAHIRRDPRIALTVLAGEDWYRHVSLTLEATAVADDDGLADIDALSTHYTGHAYPDRDHPRVSVRATVRHVHRWGR